MRQGEDFTIIGAADIDDRRRNSDRRQAHRRKIFKSARIYWENGAWTECIVRNLSDAGAQLEISAPVPGTFDLAIANRLACACSVVWRQGNRVGIKFQRHIQVTQPLPTAVFSACRQYADQCRALAKRTNDSDRDILLNMAIAWEALGLRYRRKSRQLSGA
jgi:PilZ domain